jgi:DNA polymerase III subunit gamma/tau
MSYQVIARKWRPKTFADVVGQQHVTNTLQNAIRENRIAHSYIFSGARGVGKTTTARILAKALNCVHGPTATPCSECDACLEITAGNSLDVIEIDAASNRGIDQIRELREMVRYAPAAGRYKVIILDEAHMLTDEASNALLKTLEEPPDRVIFVMATTEPENLADTIRSRSQHFHFRALQFNEITAALSDIAKKESLEIESGALAVIARAAEGSLRDALSLLEQARAYSGSKISDQQVRDLLGVVPEQVLEELVGAIQQHSAERVLSLVHQFQAEGRNLQHFCREAIRHFRNLLVAKVCGADSDLIAATPDQRPRLAEAAAGFTEEDLTRYFQILLHTDDDLRRKPDPRLHLEMGLLRLVNAARLAPLEEVLSELRGEGAHRPAPATSRATSGSAATNAPAPRSAASAAAADPAAAVSSTAAASVGFVRANAPLRAEAAAASAAPLPQSIATSAPSTAPQTQSSPREENSDDLRRAAGTFVGIEAAHVAAIKAAALRQKKFVAQIIEHVSRWEIESGELRLYFNFTDRIFADMLADKSAQETLRNAASEVMGTPLHLCVRLDSAGSTPASAQSNSGSELRSKFEQDPVVRAMLQRFGGTISAVKRRGEG